MNWCCGQYRPINLALTTRDRFPSLRVMPTDATFESFEKELNRLVESFGKRLAELKQAGYAEAQLRDDFLNPFFRALGWDMENRAGLIQREREVEIESATQIGGGRKRADYFFRTDKRDRFVCEAKKPAEELHARYAFQAKRYAWNKGVPVAVLTDFEEFKIYVVGGKPHIEEPQVGEWKSWHFRQYPLIARELWDLLSRDKVAANSIDVELDKLPKKPTGKGKARQQWLIKPDRTRALDTDFLEFLDETRRDLASDIYKNNDHDELLDGNRLTEACQRIIDRILFLRICEDRDIDTGRTLQAIVDTWRKNTGNEDTGRRSYQQPLEMKEEPPSDYGSNGIRAPKESLWRAVVRHFRALDRRPPTHVPFFNGNLFKPHFTESLIIGDEWLAGFIGDLSDDESPYLFNVIEVEILGSVYERFLGKVVRPHGRGIVIEEKPEVRKAGGVYYTPRYIVDYIVEQTAGKLLNEIVSEKEVEGAKAFGTRTEKLRLLDPACGSGSFLIRAFERVCEHWLRWLTSQLPAKGDKATEVDWEKIKQAPVGTRPEAQSKNARSEWLKKHRKFCWLDESTGDLHLTIQLKRLILTNNIYGVDLDAAAVEVTQLSLYLKMLENENRTTLQRQRELLADEADIALLPPLQDNIKHGNSLIASDFSMMPEDLVRVHAFDWAVQFAPIMKAGGFDAVIGNPPYVLLQTLDERSVFEYLSNNYRSARYKIDTYQVFVERALNLTKEGGGFGFITPSSFLRNKHAVELRSLILEKAEVSSLRVFFYPVFQGASVDTCILVAQRAEKPDTTNEIEVVRSDSPEKSAGLSIAQQKWAEHSQKNFYMPGGGLTDAVLEKIRIGSFPLGEIATAYFGIQTFDREKYVTDKKQLKAHKPVVDGGHIHRCDLRPGTEFVDFRPDSIKSGGNPAVYEAERIGVRQIGRTPIATIIPAGIYSLNTIYNIFFTKPTDLQLKFILGLFLSSTCRWFWLQQFFDQKETFPKVKKDSLLAIPVPRLDFKKPADKARHDKLVLLVDKLLGLMPKLRAATAESEKAVLQNAVTATDQQIDQLVYELYNLTPEEIALVEGAA